MPRGPAAARLDTLPPPQRRLWSELGATPRQFVLYGGTALALRLAHRTSEDFDFFSSSPFDCDRLLAAVPYLEGASVTQRNANTLTCRVDRGGPVKVSFFGDLPLRRAGDPWRAVGPGILVASVIDVAATKMNAVQGRGAARDYLDVDALLRAGVSLDEALGAALAVYGESFNPLLTLKALTFFGDGDVPAVPAATRARLVRAVGSVDPDRIPSFRALEGLVPTEDAA